MRNRIEQYRKELSRQKREWGFIDDSSGLRYVLFLYYFLLNDFTAAKRYITWFSKEFDDDCGEPFMHLAWSLILFRRKEKKAARKKLAETMIENLYLLPHLLGIKVDKYDMWHSSNLCEPDYPEYIPEQFVEAITAEDLLWIRECFESAAFSELYSEYIEVYRELQGIKDTEKRRERLNKADSLLENIS